MKIPKSFIKTVRRKVLMNVPFDTPAFTVLRLSIIRARKEYAQIREMWEHSRQYPNPAQRAQIEALRNEQTFTIKCP